MVPGLWGRRGHGVQHVHGVVPVAPAKLLQPQQPANLRPAPALVQSALAGYWRTQQAARDAVAALARAQAAAAGAGL